jgi:hypothetical protein
VLAERGINLPPAFPVQKAPQREKLTAVLCESD